MLEGPEERWKRIEPRQSPRSRRGKGTSCGLWFVWFHKGHLNTICIFCGSSSADESVGMLLPARVCTGSGISNYHPP